MRPAIKVIFAFATVIASMGSVLLAADLGIYNFNNDQNASGVAPGITMSAFSASGGIAGERVEAGPAEWYYKTSGWPTDNSVDPTKSVSFTITAQDGKSLDLTGIGMAGWTWTKSAKIAVEVPSDGVSRTKVFTANSGNGSSDKVWDFKSDLTGLKSATIRIYGFNGKSEGTVAFDNVAVYGAVTPEPYQYGLASLLGLFGLVCRDILARKRPIR